MAGVAAFGGTGFAIRPPRHQRLEEGQHGRSSFSSPSTSGPGGRIRPGHSDGSGARSRRAAVALLLLSGRARRGHRIDNPRVREAASPNHIQQLLLHALPRLRSGTCRAPPFPAGDGWLHRKAGVAHRSAPRSLATRSGARPGARAGGCPNRQQRTRERRHRLTKAQPSNPEEHGDIARAVSPACRRAPRRSSVQRPASSLAQPAVVLRAMRIHLLDTRVSRHACCTRTPRALSNTLVTLDHAGVSMRHVRVTGPVRIRRAVRGRRHQRDIQVWFAA